LQGWEKLEAKLNTDALAQILNKETYVAKHYGYRQQASKSRFGHWQQTMKSRDKKVLKESDKNTPFRICVLH
jgi:hypothetical protein